MEPSSSARPTELARYAGSGAATGAQVEAAARRLEAALAPFFARCTEYRVVAATSLAPRLAIYGRREAELAAWAGEIARGFQLADRGHAAPPLSASPAGAGRLLAEARRAALWNDQARRLIALMRMIRYEVALYGPAWPLHNPPLAALLAGFAAESGGSIVGLILAGDAPRGARQSHTSLADGGLQVLQGLWYESMEHLDPALYRDLSAELDALSLAIAADLGLSRGAPRTAQQAEPVADPRTGALGVSAAQAFPWSAGGASDPAAPFRPAPADSLAGDHSGISYFPDEQVRLERLNGATGDYRISITGLDPTKPAAPNNFEAVALTSQGLGAGNPYYEVVKARFLSDLERIPPGSTLHMQGHSMGGGMCFLLRDDPEVAQALVAAGVTVGSVITFGAVRPRGPAGEPEGERPAPFAGAEERHYVNADDSLARNVGAGHAGDPATIMLDDGQLDEPATAHTSYGDLEHYAALAPEQQTMPYVVDPATYVAYSATPTQPGQAAPATPEPAPAPTPAPTATAAPAPTPTGRRAYAAP